MTGDLPAPPAVAAEGTPFLLKRMAAQQARDERVQLPQHYAPPPLASWKTPLTRHSGQRHRCTPAFVFPCRIILPPQRGHRFACLDLVLMTQESARWRLGFSETKKERHETHTPARPNPDHKQHFLADNSKNRV
ncbi:hypothetical protein [Bifidobacterium sp. ESL0704]|uniref:hypothetical protein n=1 Tax=Bifidobacterium sp. ESL0704 TaxID=2983219 RepID=UPI0023FA1B12|nr:hypothetical protein [Bifidobacterium sp. ESL0704]WEV52236.1 hypothetical protein OZX64_04795 [Bifidobacterium sp. ESL0704]